MGREDIRSDITKEILQSYIDSGYSHMKIAIELETTQGTIFNKCKQYGLITKTKPSKYDEQAMIQYLQDGMTTSQIALKYDVNRSTVHHWINKYGLKQYIKEPPKRFDIKQCKTCVFHDNSNAGEYNYLTITGHSRSMGRPEAVCSKYVKNVKGRKRRRKA